MHTMHHACTYGIWHAGEQPYPSGNFYIFLSLSQVFTAVAKDIVTRLVAEQEQQQQQQIAQPMPLKLTSSVDKTAKKKSSCC